MRFASTGPPLASLVPSVSLHDIRFPVRPGWSNHNPAIAIAIAGAGAGDGFAMIGRSSNYVVDEKFTHRCIDPDGIVRTDNYWIELDSDLEVTSVRLIDDSGVRAADPSGHVHGFEDCRLFRFLDQWWVLATTREHNAGTICQMALMRYEDGRMEDLRLLNDPGDGIHQKNWMPFVLGRELLFVYGCRPLVMLQYDHPTGSVSEVFRSDAPEIAASFRGGSPVVDVDGGHLFVVHEAIAVARAGRLYRHRFVLIDDDFRLSKVSPRFYFHVPGVEFCAGLTKSANELFASFGVSDRKAFVARMALDEVLDALRPVGGRVTPVIGSIEVAPTRDLDPDTDPDPHTDNAKALDPTAYAALAETFKQAGQYEEAIGAFEICAQESGSDEEAAWASYRAAECWVLLNQPDHAVAACAIGLARHAGFPELSWLAGYASWRAGRLEQAVLWSRLAISAGEFRGIAPPTRRPGREFTPARWDAPFALLQFALAGLGDEAGSAEAAQGYAEAVAARRSEYPESEE